MTQLRFVGPCPTTWSYSGWRAWHDRILYGHVGHRCNQHEHQRGHTCDCGARLTGIEWTPPGQWIHYPDDQETQHRTADITWHAIHTCTPAWCGATPLDGCTPHSHTGPGPFHPECPACQGLPPE